MAICDCGAEFAPNGPKQVKCNACRFPQRTGRRPSGAPNPIQWRAIPGYEGRYEINTLGTVRNIITGKFLKTTQTPIGYRVHLDAVSRTFSYVHRLMLMTFAPIEGMDRYIAKPKNDNVYDLRLENWVWCKARAGNSKLNEDDIQPIRAVILGDSNVTYARVAADYSVSKGAVEDIMRGKNWRHVK
jgi:hypothetical protein